MDKYEVRELYPMNAFVHAGTEEGCDVRDWACPWPSEKPAKKLLRFASQPDFAPSTHYESDSEGFADSNDSLQSVGDGEGHRSESRRSALQVVNVPDREADYGLTLLAPLTHNTNDGAEVATLLPRTYSAVADHGITTLPSSTYNTTASSELTYLFPLAYDSTLRDEVENPSFRSSASASTDDESIWAKPYHRGSTDAQAEALHGNNISGYSDAELDHPRVEKKHTRNRSTSLRDQVAKSVGKFVESHSDADVKEPAPVGSINHPLLPTITGVLDYSYKFPATNSQQRGVSMPILPPPATTVAGEKKYTRHSSFGKLLNAFGKKDGEPQVPKRTEKEKKSLGRRFSQRVGRRFSSIWRK